MKKDELLRFTERVIGSLISSDMRFLIDYAPRHIGFIWIIGFARGKRDSITNLSHPYWTFDSTDFLISYFFKSMSGFYCWNHRKKIFSTLFSTQVAKLSDPESGFDLEPSEKNALMQSIPLIIFSFVQNRGFPSSFFFEWIFWNIKGPRRAALSQTSRARRSC